MNDYTFTDEQKKNLRELKNDAEATRETILFLSDEFGRRKKKFWDEVFSIYPDLKHKEPSICIDSFEITIDE